MARVGWAVIVLAAFVGCSTETSTQPVERQEAVRSDPHAYEAPKIVPENPADREIRQRLGVAIAHDSDLRDREISFIVSNGDVKLAGIVKSEFERQRINELAMDIAGVKSVANALRVSP